MVEKIKDFYIKRLGERGKISIWLVDGAAVRRDLEKDFNNFGQHFRFSFIPENEFWLDKEASPDERRFFVDHLLVEWRMMKDGQSYYAASEAGDRKEQAERKKAGDFKKVIDKEGAPVAEKVHRGILGEANEGIKIWLVDGRLVRSVFDIEFTEGGHDFVYSYVPEKEVWIDDDVLSVERPYVILHELYERALMGKGSDYNSAHRSASKIEWLARHNESKLKENLFLLGWK